MRLLPLLTGNQLDGILLTGNPLPRLPFSSGLTIGQKGLRRSLTLVIGRCIATLGTTGSGILINL